jgi:hypothetical protein
LWNIFHKFLNPAAAIHTSADRIDDPSPIEKPNTHSVFSQESTRSFISLIKTSARNHTRTVRSERASDACSVSEHFSMEFWSLQDRAFGPRRDGSPDQPNHRINPRFTLTTAR